MVVQQSLVLVTKLSSPVVSQEGGVLPVEQGYYRSAECLSETLLENEASKVHTFSIGLWAVWLSVLMGRRAEVIVYPVQEDRGPQGDNRSQPLSASINFKMGLKRYQYFLTLLDGLFSINAREN
ncbi:hypothetical protein J6590_016258 [Homalodisca vitripennis]|nr:hypothetical protein J6590_016258 [Homalodisca vitripennis]